MERAKQPANYEKRSKNIHVVYSDLAVQAAGDGRFLQGAADPAQGSVCLIRSLQKNNTAAAHEACAAAVLLYSGRCSFEMQNRDS